MCIIIYFFIRKGRSAVIFNETDIPKGHGAVYGLSLIHVLITVSFHKEIKEDHLKKLLLLFGVGEIHAGSWESYDFQVGFEENGKCCLYRLSDRRIVCV